LRQCEHYKVRVKAPIGISKFNENIDKVKDDKKKAVNLLLEEILKDVNK